VASPAALPDEQASAVKAMPASASGFRIHFQASMLHDLQQE
jgi:hypothetical protein